MCGYFCIEIIDFVLKDKSLLDYTNLSSFNEYKKNYKIIFKIIFSINKEVKMKNYIALFVVSIKNSKNLKYHTPQKKHQFFLLFAVSSRMKKKKYFKKEKNKLRYYKFLV